MKMTYLLKETYTMMLGFELSRTIYLLLGLSVSKEISRLNSKRVLLMNNQLGW